MALASLANCSRFDFVFMVSLREIEWTATFCREYNGKPQSGQETMRQKIEGDLALSVASRQDLADPIESIRQGRGHRKGHAERQRFSAVFTPPRKHTPVAAASNKVMRRFSALQILRLAGSFHASSGYHFARADAICCLFR
jgi:hypothetical protein